ncbi:terpene synthase family protein [Amycolatopsis sp. cg5]|uniref:terpene synthase family protein n=1 Tax=Amycolatopsis sp. cg5 TaxID=3238802 RepID=UPI003524D99E
MIEIPEIEIPFAECGPSPALEEAEVAMWRWVDEFELCPTPASRAHMDRTRPAMLAALSFPRADRAALTLASQRLAWAFAVDDQFDNGTGIGVDPVRCERAVVALLNSMRQEAPPPESALGRACADLWARARKGRSREWLRSVSGQMSAWLWSYYADTIDRVADRRPAMWEFMPQRRNSFGAYWDIDWCESVAGVDLPMRVRCHPGFMALRTAVLDHKVFVNDIYSLDRELAAGHRHNTVLVIRDEQKLSLDDAVDQVNLMATACVRRVTEALEELPRQLAAASISGQDYEDALLIIADYRDHLRGNFDYHALSARYHIERYNHPDELRSGVPAYTVDLLS